MRNVVFTGTIEPRTLWIWTRESRISLRHWRHLCHHSPPVARNGLKDTEMLPGFPCYSSPGLPVFQVPQKKMRQHGRQPMVVPPGIFPPFIVVHAQCSFTIKTYQVP